METSSSPHYRRGAQFVLLVDMVYPWATFTMLNTSKVFAKASALNTWWIGAVVCLDLSWAILSLLSFVLSFFVNTQNYNTLLCFKIPPRRTELLLRAWFVSMSFGVCIHLFCVCVNSQWTLLILILILRIPYFYMALLYWNDLKKLSKFSPSLLPPPHLNSSTN